MRSTLAAGCVPLAILLASTCFAADGETLTPVLDGESWQIAGNPELGQYTRPGQQPVDFAVWQAADGTWQLWSCIRYAGCGGHGRVLYRWEGQHLTDANWKPMGIAMEADPGLGEQPGGLQAPHVIRHEGLYTMAYGDWDNICFATSKDGKHFTRVVQPNGKTGVFGEGPDCNTRDPMLIQIDGLWHCYYTASPRGRGYSYCRTSPDLKTWSSPCVVSYGGAPGNGPWQNECPHVVEVAPGDFLFFRNQYYGEGARNFVYRSRNPFNFGIDDDAYLVRSWQLAAPELIHHEGQWYIASLLDSLQGIKLTRLKWVELPEVGEPVFDFASAEVRAAWKRKRGDLPAVFTDSQRSNFGSRTPHFIGTAEVGPGRFDDGLTGVIESPPFPLAEPGYLVLVSGGNDMQRLYVAVVDAETGDELARWTGDNNNALQKHRFDCSAFQGKRVVLRIVDEATGPWGHVNFGGIYRDPLDELER